MKFVHLIMGGIAGASKDGVESGREQASAELGGGSGASFGEKHLQL